MKRYALEYNGEKVGMVERDNGCFVLWSDVFATFFNAINCHHEPYQGRCVHCDVQFKNGLPAREE
jgi:hypothetical protein